MTAMQSGSLKNEFLRIDVNLADYGVGVKLFDVAAGHAWIDGRCEYAFSLPAPDGQKLINRLQAVNVTVENSAIVISGTLGGLALTHHLSLVPGKPYLEERLTLKNISASPFELNDFEAGFIFRLTDSIGLALPENAADRWTAVPFRRRPDDLPGVHHDYGVTDLVMRAGRELRIVGCEMAFGTMPSHHRWSEGWAWTRGARALGIFKFNQEAMEFSVLSIKVADDGAWLRLGGVCQISGEPSSLQRFAPGQSVTFGATRWYALAGDHGAACLAFRAWLDAEGCRFPSDYNPPVQWNELYDNPDWGLTTPGHPKQRHGATRAKTYTRASMMQEAEKARNYHCEALYLDPGWDTEFGSFKWGTDWLGPCREFIKELKSRYDLQLALHCPLATWTSCPWWLKSYGNRLDWPRESWRMAADGKLLENSICLGSRAYLDEAERRMLSLCDDGVAFLMFDGNMWNDGCWNPAHGHPVPYMREDHIRANLDLARRVHARYPRVLIEMHDMLAGGVVNRFTPVYYKYGLPGSYDENWGFELMWNPIEDLRSGRARTLVDYNLSCNVPLYLHIDLRDDNEHCLVFWWFASTCRHLGIGGTHASHQVVASQQHAMARYRALERFYKRGEFLAAGDEIHLHVLPDENAFVVNVFNLSDQSRRVEGIFPAGRLPVDPDRWYTRSGKWCGFATSGDLRVDCSLPAWGTAFMEFHSVPE